MREEILAEQAGALRLHFGGVCARAREKNCNLIRQFSPNNALPVSVDDAAPSAAFPAAATADKLPAAATADSPLARSHRLLKRHGSVTTMKRSREEWYGMARRLRGTGTPDVRACSSVLPKLNA